MRISDWSSDVCSSDLLIGLTNRTDWHLGPVQLVNIFGYRNTKLRYNTNTDGVGILTSDGSVPGLEGVPFQLIDATLVSEVKQYSDEIQLHGTLFDGRLSWLLGGFYLKSKPRSEEHTSELQSLMRISYAVFCLKN